LRDSGHVENVRQTAKQVVWDAMSKNNFVYAEIQHEKVLQHVDGKYAAKWVVRTINNNPERYTRIVTNVVRGYLERNV